MRLHLGTNPKLISADCFRLVSLKTEVQNDVEVVKPMLQELEVMRLSCALGMLSSVNPKDFELEMLEAREFDDDFARFLRQEIFGSDGDKIRGKESAEIKVVSLFGKQAEVRRELKRVSCWSNACEASLKTYDQGIFCIQTTAVGSSTTKSERVLVLFAWLQDALFDSQRLRDTATYILRFLTCLSNDVVCCLSAEDVMLMENAVSKLSAQGLDEWQSYSVAFHVEKQEVEKDAATCHQVTATKLPSVDAKAEDIFMIKGDYPAVGIVKPEPATKRIESKKLEFNNVKEFAQEVVKQSERYNIQLHFDNATTYCNEFLKAAGKWPDKKLREIAEICECNIACAEAESKDKTKLYIEEHREKLMESTGELFNVDVLHGLRKPKNAFTMLKDYLNNLHDNPEVWQQITEQTDADIVLFLPLRLQNHMKDLYVLFTENEESELSEILDKIIFQRWYVLQQKKNLVRKIVDTLGGFFSSPEDMVEKFRERMRDPLTRMKEVWWDRVERVFEIIQATLWKEEMANKISSLQAICQKDSEKEIAGAFEELCYRWGDIKKHGLCMTFDPRNRLNKVYCSVKQEKWDPPTKQLEVLKLDIDNAMSSGISSLGVISLSQDASILGVFSIKTHFVMTVVNLAGNTIVERVCFPSGPSLYGYANRRRGTGHTLRHFGRLATLCDFNVKDRVIAFVDQAGCLMLYKFNEAFTSMETMRKVELRIQTTLQAPLSDILLGEHLVYLTDHTGLTQSVNLRSHQTSRKTRLLHSDREATWKSKLIACADGLVLAYFTLSLHKQDASTGQSSFTGAVSVISSEDYREIPVNLASEMEFLSKELSVQCMENTLFIVDRLAAQVYVVRIDVTVRSDSYRIRHSSGHNNHNQRIAHEDSESIKDSDHWLWVFYHLYEKFPVAGLIFGQSMTPICPQQALKLKIFCADTTSYSVEDSCRCYFEAVMAALKGLNKPLHGMDLVRSLTILSSACDADVEVANLQSRLCDLPTRSILSFLRDLVTFVPIQICRAESNTLTVMTDGQDRSNEVVLDESRQFQSVDIARSIRFGLLSPLLESWRGRCIVVTSMGKQSTGKSYFLNHLTGSSFAIAGSRCTDGAWMTVRVLPNDVLLILLDFEGLGSFERSEQEDVFLSVLNASISMFTVFRMEMRFDKEIDDLFAKFQKGVQLIKNDPRLFRGKLYMSVKDVNPNDQKGVLDEFVTKFEKVLGANKENNFLTDLYSGQLDINCSPPLGTTGYYQSLMHAQRYIERQLCNDTRGFATGKDFLNCIRLVLAKISILDWTSVDESAQKFKIAEMQEKLPALMRTGCLIPVENVADTGLVTDYVKEDIRLPNGHAIEATFEILCRQYPALSVKWRQLRDVYDIDCYLDRDIDLGFDFSQVDDSKLDSIGTSLHRLFMTYLSRIEHYHSGKLERSMQTNFDVFLAFVTRRRRLRITIWAQSLFDDRIPDEWKAVEQQYLGRLQTIFARCQNTCASCRLGCMHSASHSVAIAHDCHSSHQCRGRCEYCVSSEQEGKTPACAKLAGHDGMCECQTGDHTCGATCCMELAPNCGKRCTLKKGHTELHKCDVLVHSCGEPCAALGCSGRCIHNIELPHSTHKCVEVRCIQKCLMNDCSHLCGVMDHFHGQTDVSVAYSVENGLTKDGDIFDAASAAPVIHMCDGEHACPAMCGENGICHVDVYHKQSSKVFAGARGEFKYTFQEMNGRRKKCARVLQSGQQTHTGVHSCLIERPDRDNDEEEVTKVHDDDGRKHFCDVRCPCCSYFCSKDFGHSGFHKTSHGNMRNTFFLADSQDIDVNDRKYQVGELGIAEMCNLYCSAMGRGHVHYLECEQGNATKCVYSGTTTDQRRHCTRALEPHPQQQMDEVLHEQFWKTLGWEDPTASVNEREQFGKCPFKCDAPEHDVKKSFCVLPAWHDPVKKNSVGHDGFSYVDGHKFECSHAVDGGKMHHIFVLDCSGSMQGWPWKELLAAWREYLFNRIDEGASMDLVSIVTFDNSSEIVYEAQNIMTLTQVDVPYRGGGTSFAAGLRAANEVLSRNNFELYKPVIIFFSDGHPHDPHEGGYLATHLRNCYEKYDLQAFAVGFGTINLHVLQRVAEKMGGSYYHVLTGTEMKSTFYTISTSLGARAGLALTKPSHEEVCPICQKELISEETIKLRRCNHELHTGCWDTLMSNTSDSATALCPVCRTNVA